MPLRGEAVFVHQTRGANNGHDLKEGLRTVMPLVVKQFPNPILDEEEGPFITLYQPTYRYAPKNRRDAIVFKNLVRQIEKSLMQKVSARDIKPLMDMFRHMEQDKGFWMESLDGLAVLATLKTCAVYRLPVAVKPLALVAERFHIKPLLRFFQSADKYQLLGLSGNAFSLFEGNRYALEEIHIPSDVPRTMQAVLGDQLTQEHLSHGSYAGTGGPAMFHGHGGKKDEVDKDREKFFRYVDKTIWENYSRPSGLPLILAALGEYHPVFHKLSDNPQLVERGIKGSFASFERSQLREKAWEIMQPHYKKKAQALSERFENAKNSQLASDDASTVARAAVENRVEAVLLEEDRIFPGKVLRDTGALELGQMEDPSYGDILDDLASIVLSKKGEVVVLSGEDMPVDTGVAAIFRF